MKLYFLDLSPPCRAVDMVVHSLNLSVEYEKVNFLARDQLRPEFTKLNPTHTIPTLDDNGFILYDSHAICSYLVSKYGKNDSLYPKDLMKRAKVDEQLHYHNEVFIVFKSIVKPLFQGKLDTISAENIVRLNEICNILEKMLEKQQYFAGNELTIADFSFISLVPSFEVFLPISADKYPHLNVWMTRCEKTIKNYDKCNAEGNEAFISTLKKYLKDE